jgi:hypothetical protein
VTALRLLKDARFALRLHSHRDLACPKRAQRGKDPRVARTNALNTLGLLVDSAPLSNITQDGTSFSDKEAQKSRPRSSTTKFLLLLVKFRVGLINLNVIVRNHGNGNTNKIKSVTTTFLSILCTEYVKEVSLLAADPEALQQR